MKKAMVVLSGILFGLILSAALANAAGKPIAVCRVPNINPEGSPQSALAVLERDASTGKLIATLTIDNNTQRMGAEPLAPTDPIAQIYISDFERQAKQNPNYASYKGFGFLGQIEPGSTSRYQGALLVAFDHAGAALGAELYVWIASGKCQ